MSRRKKGGHGGGGGHDGAGGLRWLLTYADMITLVMAFFIMLFAMSQVDKQKFEEAAFAIRAGFNSSKATDSPRQLVGGGPTEAPPKFTLVEKNEFIRNTMARDPKKFSSSDGGEKGNGGTEGSGSGSGQNTQEQEDKPIGMTAEEIARLQAVGNNIKARLAQQGLAKNVEIIMDERGLVVRIKSDNILFDLGRADLRPRSLPILDTLSKTLAAVPNQIRVEGHTDSLPISTIRYPSNWELSTARASSVIRYWLRKGSLSEDKLSAAGYADSHPVATNVTGFGRALNRRVEVVVAWKGS